ncbi:multidrug ABC transporter permease [Mycobacterium tuberculosis]|jgi:ABC transporter DrrB family efflux protein|nr:multidrug ABC transporter permease [Mycobacterium tuberculosis]
MSLLSESPEPAAAPSPGPAARALSAASSGLDLTPVSRPQLLWALSDILQLAKRSLLHIRQDPDQLVSVTVQPVILVVMFRYLFGGAISTGSEESYINFLMAGIFIETAALTATATSTAVAVDMLTGAMDRFRSLPMVNSAVLAGHVLADLARSAFGMVAMVALGLAVGFRPHAGVLGWIGALGLTFLVTFTLSWIAACIGLLGSSVEAAQQFAFVLLLPIFFSSAFVPAQTMPGWLRVVVDNQPLTHAIDAVRALLLAQPTDGHVQATLVWFVGMSLVAIVAARLLFKARTSK